MNKKLNTALFLVVATLVNIVIMLILWLVPLFLYIRFLAPYISEGLTTLIVIVIFIGAIVATYFLYNLILKRYSAKVDMDRHFEPLFRKKKAD